MTAPAVPEVLKDGSLVGTWVLDPGASRVWLRSRSLWGLAPVKGVFGDVSGSGTILPGGGLDGTLRIRAASIETGNPRRDRHIRSADLLDADNHPEIVFRAERVVPRPGGVGVSGTLRVRGQTRPLSLDAALAVDGDSVVALDAGVVIDRSDFGVSWNMLRGTSMRNVVRVHAVFTRS